MVYLYLVDCSLLILFPLLLFVSACRGLRSTLSFRCIAARLCPWMLCRVSVSNLRCAIKLKSIYKSWWNMWSRQDISTSASATAKRRRLWRTWWLRWGGGCVLGHLFKRLKNKVHLNLLAVCCIYYFIIPGTLSLLKIQLWLSAELKLGLWEFNNKSIIKNKSHILIISKLLEP